MSPYNITYQIYYANLKDPIYIHFLNSIVLCTGADGKSATQLPNLNNKSEIKKFIYKMKRFSALDIPTCRKLLKRTNRDGFIQIVRTCDNCEAHLHSEYIYLLHFDKSIDCCSWR